MILILTTSVTARLEYVFSLLLREMLGISYAITTSRDEWLACQGPKLCYAKEPAGDGPFIEATGLLFETVVFPHELKVVIHNGLPVLFESHDARSELGFDPFAASFYMVTRYEEYHRSKKDKFGRFKVTESIAWKGKFLERPVVHEWAGMLGSFLETHFPGLPSQRRHYSFVPTIDIDHAFAFRGRSLIRSAGGIGRSFLKGDLGNIRERLKVLYGCAKDTYDNYDFIREVHDKYGVKPFFFILFADYGGNDNQVSTGDKEFRQLLGELDMDHGVGIHPSLSSNRHFDRLRSETLGLSEVLGHDITFSRQHFLKISFPKTYRNLIKLGISDDYSMGYGSHTGFRAGMAIPYRFFDLSKNEKTDLTIHPVAIMDVTLRDYNRLNAQQSLETIREVIKKVRSVNGVFISLWHNESLSGTGHWNGWRKVYEELLREAAG